MDDGIDVEKTCSVFNVGLVGSMSGDFSGFLWVLLRVWCVSLWESEMSINPPIMTTNTRTSIQMQEGFRSMREKQLEMEVLMRFNFESVFGVLSSVLACVSSFFVEITPSGLDAT